MVRNSSVGFIVVTKRRYLLDTIKFGLYLVVTLFDNTEEPKTKKRQHMMADILRENVIVFFPCTSATSVTNCFSLCAAHATTYL